MNKTIYYFYLGILTTLFTSAVPPREIAYLTIQSKLYSIDTLGTDTLKIESKVKSTIKKGLKDDTILKIGTFLSPFIFIFLKYSFSLAPYLSALLFGMAIISVLFNVVIAFVSLKKNSEYRFPKKAFTRLVVSNLAVIGLIFFIIFQISKCEHE
ncbi:MAG: hypothetical protein ACRCVT_06840 [Leadbetterella sp.]